MNAALRLEGVDKSYGLLRKYKALDGLTFSVPRGSICGLIGPNGAGKTTTFSVLCGFLPADSGVVDVLGEGPFDPMRHKGRVGVLPQDADIGLRQTPRELLEHLGRLQGLPAAEARSEGARLLEQLNLGPRAGHPLATLSHGMRRRVAVAMALIGSPELVLLDEPTSGLDPRQNQDLRALLFGLKGRCTLVISSHVLAELELLCDYVVMVDRGRCVRAGRTEEVTAQRQQEVWTLGPGTFDLEPLRSRLPGHTFSLDGAELSHEAPVDVDLDETSVVIAGEIARQALPLRGLRRGHSLERAFLGGTEGS